MPTECERSITSPTTVQGSATELKDNLTTLTGFNEHLTVDTMMEGDMSTSQTSTTSNGSSTCNGGRKTSITSPDPTAYVAKARVTRPTPPPPPYNPMQFVQIKPCNLYQTAQEQLKKAEEVKKIKEIRKEEPEDWQNNLDNWKSSRRKRVEHIIDRVVEVKKLELEEHDRTRRKSKTFSEMIEERGERSGGRGLNKLASLAVYAEDEANDLSDLGIGTSSASGKSSLSEDYDNNSVMSDNAAELDKAITNNTHNKPVITGSTTREYISSPGYETSSSTAPASSPDPCEYTYEGAIQDYKQRVSRAASGLTSVALNKLTTFNSQQQQQLNSKESTPERPAIKEASYPPRRGSKIEDRLMGFEVQSPSEECVEKNKVDVPKIDISKRKEIFEAQDNQNSEPKSQLLAGGSNNAGVPRVTLRDRFKVQETTEVFTEQPKKDLKRLSGDITSIKERLQSLEQQQNLVNGANGATKTTANKLVDIPVPPLKERLSSLQNAVTKEEVRKPPVKLVDARQLEIMKSEEEKAQQTLKEVKQAELGKSEEIFKTPAASLSEEIRSDEIEDVDRDDSGIHTADDVDLEERHQADIMKKEQELKLNAAIEALAKEEKQLSEAANAVNQIEAEFEELTLGSVSLPPLANNANANAAPITNEHMEYSVSFTNPEQTKTCSNSYSREMNSNNFNSQSSEKNNGDGNSKCETVKGLDFKSTTNLRRKPTNEMVHAKNLLKIFKETFQNDIELDEHEAHEDYEIKNIQESENSNSDIPEDFCVKTQVFESSKIKEFDADHSSSPSHTPLACSKIPRSMTPLGKPPLSPLTIRSSTKFIACLTPPGSPSMARKPDSQFSINGRVEIFNSKTMTISPNSANLVKPLTPTMTTKKTQLPYIYKTTKETNNIELPNQQQQQMTQEVTTKQQQEHTLTVIEPLPTSKKSLQQQPQHYSNDNNKHVVEMKSKPFQQLVNEPQTKLNQGETYQQHQINHNKQHLQLQQQQQETEVVVCAPPITIVNPDELPKPNTVKNLSSCFQQQQKDNNHVKPIPPPKPLPRFFKGKQTPPPSPVLPRRHISEKSTEEPKNLQAEKSENNKAGCDRKQLPRKEEQQREGNQKHNANFSSSPLEDKESSLISNALISSSTSSATSIVRDKSKELELLAREGKSKGEVLKQATEEQNKSISLDLQEDKKLSITSSDSTSSSSSTGSTVIDNSKKLSIQSDISSTSENIQSEQVTITAQIHKQPQGEELSQKEQNEEQDNNMVKNLDQETTQSLVQEIIRAENQARSLGLKSKIPKNNSLAPLKIDTAKEQFNISSTASPTTPNHSLNIHSQTTTSSLPFTTPLQPLKPLQSPQSPTKELFKITTPLVVSTLYDKYQPDPSSPTNYITPLAPLQPTKPIETSPGIIKPAEVPSPPDCPPNDSTLYKLVSSVPQTPNSEKNLSLDADICKSLLTSLAVTPEVLQRQHTVEEEQCQKVDKEALPFYEGATGFKDITKDDINKSEGLKATSVSQLKTPAKRQTTLEEEMCQKIDIKSLPDDEKLQPKTGFKCVSPTEIRKCDNFFALGSEKSTSKNNSKPNSPILQARAAHSKALIETCERIIAEERLASSQLKSSLPSTPQSTPLMQKISKIPKPITSCCKANESLNEADLNKRSPQQEKQGAIARLHVVETQIKVTTTTPPASPKASTKSQSSSQPAKKTKNIFDFLKKNFGVGGHSHKQQESPETSVTDAANTADAAVTEKPILVLTEEELKALDQVKYDEVHKFDNSKFYISTQAINDSDGDDSTLPPPLPKTPAPVNIEITRKITTDEILEGGKSEKDLTKEIDDLLDDELNKLNHEIQELEKAGGTQ